MLEERVGRLEKKGKPHDLYFIAVPGTKLQAGRKAEACVARDDTTLHGQKMPSVTTPRRDRTK